MSSDISISSSFWFALYFGAEPGAGPGAGGAGGPPKLNVGFGGGLGVPMGSGLSHCPSAQFGFDGFPNFSGCIPDGGA